MRYEIDTVLAGARAERLEQRDMTRDHLEGLLQKSSEHAEASIAARGKLAVALRQLAAEVEEGEPPFDTILRSDDVGAVTERAKNVLKGLPSKYDARRLERDIKEARAHHTAAEKDHESFLESYLRAALAAGETHISTNALKEAGVSPRETLDLVAKGQQARFGSNA